MRKVIQSRIFWPLFILFVLWIVGTLTTVTVWAGPATNGGLPVEQFLEQVATNNGAVRGALEASRGARDRSEEGNLLFSPTLVANASVMDDKRVTLVPASQGDETRYRVLEVGYAQMTRFGLMTKLTFEASKTELLNANPMYIQTPVYNNVAPKLEASLPLWRNLLGREYRGLESAQNASAKAASFGKEFEAQMLLLDAEVKYWKLAAVRESIRIVSMNVDQTKEILRFNTQKYKRGLSDINEVLQAQAALKARLLDLQIAKNEEREAMRSFNAARRIDSSVVPEKLTLPGTLAVLERLKQIPQRTGLRNDVRAAEQGYLAVRAASQASRERTRPDLNLVASASLNGRGLAFSDAYKHSFDTDHPYFVAGVKVSIPFDFFRRGRVRDGYEKEAIGAELAYQQKAADQESEWTNLCEKLTDLRERLVLAEELRTAQQEKLEKERERQRQGKSTTFQVFAFEQEFLGSQLAVVQTESAALAILAQAKLYAIRGDL